MVESFLQWDPAQVSAFVQSYANSDVTTAFINNNIDGSLLPFLTTEHLHELGIEHLGTRLRVKRAINDLIAGRFDLSVPSGPNDPDLRLTAININSNYVSMEALSLCAALLRDLRRSTEPTKNNVVDVKKLNDNFKKLKADLNPVIRLVKDSKPLPTPTLDPGVPLPTQSVSSIFLTNSWLTDGENIATLTPTRAATISKGSSVSSQKTAPKYAPGSANPGSTKSASSTRPHSVASTTFSNQLSSGTILSMGVGKVADLKIPQRTLGKPRLVEAKKSPGIVDETTEYPFRTPALKSKASLNLMASRGTETTTQPLKQLKASTDDTCLKVLQQAMRRHHIPREKWSKYVLVICYGDKERILKLTEKPVLVFKELKESEKNPTIMLRELAPSTIETEKEYEDSRIADEIPGGTL